jgi:hypothetical protein
LLYNVGTSRKKWLDPKDSFNENGSNSIDNDAQNGDNSHLIWMVPFERKRKQFPRSDLLSVNTSNDSNLSPNSQLLKMALRWNTSITNPTMLILKWI